MLDQLVIGFARGLGVAFIIFVVVGLCCAFFAPTKPGYVPPPRKPPRTIQFLVPQKFAYQMSDTRAKLVWALIVYSPLLIVGLVGIIGKHFWP
jgi:hypothetical protein